jgi:hypothetical protein
MKHLGSSRQIDIEQSNPGGHSFSPNFSQREFSPQVAEESQVLNARQRPKAPLEQY